ncbi:barstar family protein [Microbulbifer guangxiensis]|uniref:barstar family protein n=1 Tax=Microbulbifer guangxiensis TaxID=2904249 RepID=UPI003F6EF67F
MACRRWFHDTCHSCIPKQGRIVEIPGELIRSALDFYCSIGEAVNGPGGYFGSEFHSFDDCLFGGFGLEAPYEIVWRNSEISKRHLGSDVLFCWANEKMEPDNEEWAREVRECWAANNETFFNLLLDAMTSVSQRFLARGHEIKVTLA